MVRLGTAVCRQTVWLVIAIRTPIREPIADRTKQRLCIRRNAAKGIGRLVLKRKN